MAKRVFELAKELGVASKAIVGKCEAEGIPNVHNHMSSLSAGQVATIREWFSGGGGADMGEHPGEEHHTTIELSAPVDLEAARNAASKAKAKPKARSFGGGGDEGPHAPSQRPAGTQTLAGGPAVVETGERGDAATELREPPARTDRDGVDHDTHEGASAGSSARPALNDGVATPVARRAVPAHPPARPPVEPPATSAGPAVPRQAPVEQPREAMRPVPDARDRHAGAPAAPAGPDSHESETSGGPSLPGPGTSGREEHRPGGEQHGKPLAPAARQGGPGAPTTRSGASPRMNVPMRPTVVSPAGPKLDVQTPAKLSGPRVVRIETPDVIEAPRARRPMGDGPMPSSRGPRSGGGAGAPAGPGAPGAPGAGSAEAEAERNRRNKRRVGPGAPAGPVARGPTSRRTGKADADTVGWSAQDLAEREARLSRSDGFLRQRRRDQKMKDQGVRPQSASLAETGGKVSIAAPFTIKELSAATGVKSAEIVKRLFLDGIMSTSNSGIEPERAQEIMMEYDIELDVTEARSAEAEVVEQFTNRESIEVRSRAPVVTILGHVDHGKTSLLDKIRNTKIAAGEAGGITQSTRAFRVSIDVEGEEKTITFLDTPGHEAFSEMRARGANMTDVVVLVVSAVDGVMPQTIESIKHAQAAKVPVVVALNKIDVPGITDGQIQQIFGKLAEQDLSPVEWGGNTEVVRTSALTGLGLDTLLTTLDLQSQILELKADYKGPARGRVIEAKMEEGRGATAQILVQDGELKVGDIVVAGRAYGRIRDITDDRGKRVQKAYPSMPVLISGIAELPDAGDKFYIVDSIRTAQDAAEQRQSEERMRELAQPKVTLDTMFAAMKETEAKELLLVVKADVQGSVDVIRQSVEKVSTDAVKVRVLHAAAGGITESDVNLAATSKAVIMGFNVIASGRARQLAEQRGVEIRSYQVIYDIIDDVKKAAAGLLAPEIRLEVLGHAEVRQVFKVSKVGTIAGCYVTDGVIERNALIRVTRDGIVIENDRLLEQLKRFKDDAKEVKSGTECGMKIVGYDNIKQGDVLECYRKVEVRATL